MTKYKSSCKCSTVVFYSNFKDTGQLEVPLYPAMILQI